MLIKIFKFGIIIDKIGILLYFIPVENKLSDIETILKDCGVYTEQPQSVLKRLAGLEEFYNKSELVEIYNYILLHVENEEILIGTIRLADANKASSTLAILTEMLVKKRTADTENDIYIDLRAICAKAISNYRDNSTVILLMQCLNNKTENYKVRLACADALGRIGDKYAVPALIDVVKDDEERSVYVKEAATFALGLLGDTSVIDPLVSIMEAKQGLWDKFSFLKERIIEVLGKLNISNSKVLRVLKSSLMDASPIVRINTIEALMNSEFEEAEELKRTALKD